MKKLLLILSTAFLQSNAFAAPTPTPAAQPDTAALRRSYLAYVDSVNNTFSYQQGHIKLPGGIGELTVPRGFRYLDSAQSRRLLTQVWGNPNSESLGMLMPAGSGPLSKGSWAYVIQYEGLGYVKDDDADDINYEELLEEMQADTEDGNQERVAAGYEPVHLLGWASAPYYDKDKHTLHWAKTLRFGGDSAETTLNYNVRLLGRKGVLVMNAVGAPEQLGQIKASIPDLLGNVTFSKGQQYADFDANLDDVAAYGIGGLVAGKVLAKVGFFAILLKFWKIGLLALAGAWAGLKRFLGFGGREE